MAKQRVLLFIVLILFSLLTVCVNGQDNDNNTGNDDDVGPAPASIGADVPLSYFGPAPSDVQPELIGPFQLLKAAVVDTDAGTVEVSLYHGSLARDNSYNIWYVLTDTTDEGNAKALGINHSPKLRFSATGRGARSARQATNNELVFNSGTVDFTPERNVVPGDAPNYFPPAVSQPGSVGSSDYSPLVTIRNNGNHVYNAPIVAGNVDIDTLNQFCDGIPDDLLDDARTFLHDSVVSICVDEDSYIGTVTLKLVPGFSFSRPVLYLSLDASDETVAGIEAVTFAPGLQDIKVGGDDSFFSSVERIFVTINGYTNEDINPEQLSNGPGETSHPSRQGLNSAVNGEGSPLNVLGGIPTIATDYSPLWDINMGQWTDYAIDNGYRVRLLEEFQILGLVNSGFITGPNGDEYGSVGAVVNCPIVFRFL